MSTAYDISSPRAHHATSHHSRMTRGVARRPPQRPRLPGARRAEAMAACDGVFLLLPGPCLNLNLSPNLHSPEMAQFQHPSGLRGL